MNSYNIPVGILHLVSCIPSRPLPREATTEIMKLLFRYPERPSDSFPSRIHQLTTQIFTPGCAWVFKRAQDQTYQTKKPPLASHQLSITALFYHMALVHYKHHVEVADCREALLL